MDLLDALLRRAKRSFLQRIADGLGDIAAALQHPLYHEATERLLFREVIASIPADDQDIIALHEEQPWIWEYAPEAEWIYPNSGWSPDFWHDRFRARLAYVVWVELARFWTEKVSANERTIVCSVSKKRGLRFKEVTLRDTIPHHDDSHD